MMIKNFKGFTLLELIIAIGVVGVLASLALPAFDTQMKNSRLVVNANSLVGALGKAREEASFRGLAVKVEDSGNGWAVREVLSNDLIQQYEPDDSGLTWTPASLADVTFNSTGFRPFGSAVVSVKLCDDRGLGREITISPAGSTSMNTSPTCP